MMSARQKGVIKSLKTKNQKTRKVDKPSPRGILVQRPADLSTKNKQKKVRFWDARAEKLEDLLSCSDKDLRLQIRVTRRTLKTIFDAIKLVINDDFKFNDLLMLVWYLSSKETTLEDVASVFGIAHSDAALERLKDTSAQVLGLMKNAKIYFPSTEFEEDEIVECFQRETGFPNIMGALGMYSLNCLDGSYIDVLFVCDHRRFIRHLTISSNKNKTEEELFKGSSIYKRLKQKHPKGYFMVISQAGGLEEEAESADLYDQVFKNYLQRSTREMVGRFPKVLALDTDCLEILAAAFTLHNLCKDTRDSSLENADFSVVPVHFND